MSIQDTIIIGCSGFAGMYERLGETDIKSQQICCDIVQEAINEGIRCFDTAPHYGCGLSEERLGIALQKVDPVHLNEIKVWTKVGRLIYPYSYELLQQHRNEYVLSRVDMNNIFGKECVFEESSIDRTPYFDYTKDGIRKSFQDSLRRLQCHTLFGLRLHDFDTDERMNEIIFEGGLNELWEIRREGLIKDVSIGVNSPSVVLRLFKMIEGNQLEDKLLIHEKCFDSILLANSWNLLDHPYESELLFRICHNKKITIHNAGIFASGALLGGRFYKYKVFSSTSEIYLSIQRLRNLANNLKVDIAQLAMKFSLSRREEWAIAAIVVGVKNIEELKKVCYDFRSLENISETSYLELMINNE